MSNFERYALQRLFQRAERVGVAVPEELASFVCGSPPAPAGARIWAAANPDVEVPICCAGSDLEGPAGCTCWVPVYDLEQAEPVPPVGPGDLPARLRACGDCAYRADSPERAEQWTAQGLMDLAEAGVPFYCHDGMRRPTQWLHPDGRRVDGSPDDYQPPIVGGLPYRADGQPALLCAGWLTRMVRAAYRR